MRTVGLLLLFAVSSLGGIAFSRRAGRSVAQLREILRLLEHIEVRSMTCFEALPDIYDSFSSPELSSCGFWDAWRRDPASALRCVHIPEEANEALLRLSEKLGKGGRELTGEQIRSARAALADITEEEEKKLPQKQKAALTLGFSIGALSLLLLW